MVLWHRALVPMHTDLRLAGQLPPLDAPHHMRASEWAPFREGVVTRSAHGAGSVLNIGLDKARAAPPSAHFRAPLALILYRRPHCLCIEY